MSRWRVRPSGGDLILVSVSVPALHRHPEETHRSLICNHGAESLLPDREGAESSLWLQDCVPPGSCQPCQDAVAILAKGYREAAGHQPGGKGLTLGAGVLLLVGGGRILQVFVREETQGHLASCWLSPN